MRRAAWMGVAWLLGCGSAQTRTASSAPVASPNDLPRIEGRAVYDVPLREASPPVAHLFAAAQSMLADPLPAPPAGADPPTFQAWTRDVLGHWAQARRAALAGVQRDAHQLEGGPTRDRLFATVVLSILYDDFANQVRTIPPPPSVADDPRARDAYREVITATMAPLGRIAREGFVQCAEIAGHANPPLRDWRAACESHAQTIADWLPPDASSAPSAMP